MYDQLMATLIVTVLFGLIIAFFATQNSGAISLNFLSYTIPGIPVYIVVAGALLLGLFLSWIISIVSSISTGLTLRGKDHKIKDIRRENADLTKRIHQLELENSSLEARVKGHNPDNKSL